MRARPRGLQVIGVALAAVLLAGCGSTVQQSGSAALPGQVLGEASGELGLGTSEGGDGLTAPVPGGGTAVGGGSAGAVGVAPGTTGGSGGGAAGAPGSSGGASSGSSTGGAVTRPLKIGVTVVDFSALASSFGVAAATTDPYAPWKRIITHLNKTGGLGGRLIEAEYYSIDGAASNSAGEIQAACIHFAQDRKVEIVLSVGVNDSKGFSQCLLKYGIPQFDSGQYVEDAPQLAKTPNQFTNGALAHDRMASTLMQVALSRGWLSTKDKLGVLTQECPVDNRVYDKQIVPAMKKAGIPVIRATTNCLEGNADIGAAASQIQGAVLRFRSEGVTQVTMLGAPEGAGILLFTQNASQQKYYPGYLLTSNAFAHDNSQGNWPADQLSKMKGIGFSPLLDVGLKAPTTPRQVQAQAACKEMDPTTGDSGSASQPTAVLTFFYAICDTFQLLKGILGASRGQVGIPTFVDLYPRVISSTPSAKLYDGTFAGDGRRDGARTVVPFSYKPTGCRCMSFDGGAVPTQ